jgi:predicted ATPase/DNA-binding SARP family transcriptional activator
MAGNGGMRLELRVLGGFELRRGGEPVQHWPRAGPRQLLKRLALSERQAMSLEALADSLWPDDTGARVMQRLHHQLYLLRKTLHPDDTSEPCLRTDGSMVRLISGEPLWIDLVAFEQQLEAAGSSDDEAGLLEQALALYRGRLLGDEADEDWLAPRRAQIEGRFVAASHRLAAWQTQEGRLQTAIQTLNRLLAEVPSHEPAHRELITLFGRLGRVEDVQRQFNECVAILQRELDATPAAETCSAREAALSLAAPLAAGAAALPSDESDGQRSSPGVARDKPSRWAVPHPVVALLGRDEAVGSAVQQLRDGVRLLSLVGTGGVGKTQLAIRIAHDAQPHYPQGACFVPLAESRPGELYPAIARALGLKLPQHEEPKATVWRALQHSRLLLVVDNFEHMMGEAAELALMLAHCAQLSLLVTGRMRLNLVAETCVAVPPLAVEHNGQELPEALRMFIACARRVRPGLEWCGLDADEAAAITTYLGGLPLAIELAAARLPLFSPSELRRAIEASLQVVTGGGADRPLRQRSLQHSFRWSYALLSANEQSLLLLLALCDASFDHRDARGLAGTGVKDPELELQTLVELGFVMPAGVRTGIPDAAVESRFEIAAAIREFVRQELQQHSERAALHGRFIDHFIQRADRLDAAIDGSAARLALVEFGDQSPNFFAALNVAREVEEPEGVCRLVASLARLWFHGGIWHEAKPWIEWASTRVSAIAAAHQAQLMTRVAMYWKEYRCIDQAIDAAALAVQFAEEARQPANQVRALMISSGLLWSERGDRAAALALVRRARELARQDGDIRLTGWVAMAMVTLEMSPRNLEANRRALDAWENEFTQTTDSRLQLGCHRDLAVLNSNLGDYEKAHLRFDQALNLEQSTVARPAWRASTLVLQAWLYCAQMDAANAHRTLDLARVAARDAQAESMMPSLLWLKGHIAMLASDWRGAIALLSPALCHASKDHEPWEALEAILWCAWAAIRDESNDLAAEALSVLLVSTSINALNHPRVAEATSAWLLTHGREEAAALAWLQACALRRRTRMTPFPIDRAMSEETRLDLIQRLGDDWEVHWQDKTPACDGDHPLAWLAEVVTETTASAVQPTTAPPHAPNAAQSTPRTPPPPPAASAHRPQKVLHLAAPAPAPRDAKPARRLG